MNHPKELRYAKTHEWVKLEGDKAVIGLSDYAQKELGDLVFVNLPEVGDTVDAGTPFGDVESVKAVSDINAPVTGTVTRINEEVLDSPELINSDPYGTWLIEVEPVEGEGALMGAEEYEACILENE